MTKIEFNFKNITKKQLLLLFCAVVLLIAVQVLMVKYMKVRLAEINEIRRDNMLLDSVFKSRAESLSYFKSSVNLDEANLPEPAESPTAFYSLLINLLSANNMEDTVVVKDSDEGGEYVSFNLSGTNDYFALMRLLLSFRQSGTLMRVSNISIMNPVEGNVDFSFIVQAKLSAVSPAKDGAK